MKLMVRWQIHQDKRHDALAAFGAMALRDYQSQQGPAIKIIGRWHDVNNLTGVAICETNDASALGLYLLKWSTVCNFEIVPVLDDEEAHAAVTKTLAGS